MAIEPITEHNIKAVWDLYQRAVCDCDRLPLDWFRYKILGDPDLDPELALVAVESGRPVAFTDAVARELGEGPVGFLKAWATDEQWRGQGIASALLERVEDRLRRLSIERVEAGWARPHYFTPGIDASAYTPAVAFLLRRGFKYRRMSYNMDVPLTGRAFRDGKSERRLVDQGITARRLEKSEKQQFVSWMDEDGWSPGWQYQVGAACDADPTAVFVAERSGRYIGFAVYDAVRPGWFGPMGTSQSLRGSGIGGVLFLMCLDDMRQRGYVVCHVCAVGPLYFYSKVADAAVSRTFWIMDKEL